MLLILKWCWSLAYPVVTVDDVDNGCHHLPRDVLVQVCPRLKLLLSLRAFRWPSAKLPVALTVCAVSLVDWHGEVLGRSG